jgi:hypothetical protein
MKEEKTKKEETKSKPWNVKSIHCHIGVSLGNGAVVTSVIAEKHKVDFEIIPVGVVILKESKPIRLIPYANIQSIILDE